MGTKLKNLLTDHRVHKRSKDCECCRSWNEDPRVEYRIFTPHENQWITTGNVTDKVWWIEGNHRLYYPDILVRCHWKRDYLNYLDNLTEFEDEWYKENIGIVRKNTG